MGPAPMIRIVEISVLFGIKSHGRGNWAQKKGAHTARPSSQERVFLARGWSLDQIPQPRKGHKHLINRHFAASAVALRAMSGRPERLACQLKPRRLEARPGFEPG